MHEYGTREYHREVANRLLEKYEECDTDFSQFDIRVKNYMESVVYSPDNHNLYELLSVLRFLRQAEEYEMNFQRAKYVIDLEDVLEFKSDSGPVLIKLSPCQVFQITSIFGFLREVEVEQVISEGDEFKTLTTFEKRQLVTHFILMVPRKFGKTTEMVFFSVDDFLFGDDDAEIYCCSNSDKQSKILFGFIKYTLQHLDPKKKYFRTTVTEASWIPKASTQTGKTSIINSLSGGATTKDGLKASLHLQDEYGAAKYVNGHSDSAALYQVVTSSMGTRKNPLSGIITTAGRVLDGPFQPMLENAKAILRAEMDENAEHYDTLFAHIFQPDEWEMGDEYMGDEHLWRKVQPHFGYTVQSNYYKDKYNEALRDHEAYIEFNTKLLNKFVSDNVEEWISAQKIIDLQGTRYIDDLKSDEDEWICFIGCDFSKGDDLCDMTYLCYNPQKQRYLLDCDCWITEETYEKAAKNPLYRKWADEGHLHISKGKVIDEDALVERLDEINQCVNILKIGYDRYSSLRFINRFKFWMMEMGVMQKDIDGIIVAISQLNSQFNAACEEMLYMVNEDPSILEVSPNPVIPWCFSNCYLQEDAMGNKKPQKSLKNGKIDVVIGALEGIILLEKSDL